MIKDNVLEILKRVKNKEISIQDGTQILNSLKDNNNSKVLYYQNDNTLIQSIVHQDIQNEFIIVFANNKEHINFIKQLELELSDRGNQLLLVTCSDSFSQSQNNVEIDITNESDFEKLSDYVYCNYKNRKIHIIYMLDDTKTQMNLDNQYKLNVTAIFVLYIAKNFAYRFSKQGVRFQIFSVERDTSSAVFQEAIVAIGKSIEKEVPSFITQVIMANKEQVSNVKEIIKAEMNSTIDTRFVRYQSNRRLVDSIAKKLENVSQNQGDFPEGVYIILGGMGAIGKSVATEIAKVPNTKIILVGRRSLTNEMEEFLGSIKNVHSEINYMSADICDTNDMEQVFYHVTSKYQKIDYVFHCAGVLEDCKLPNKKVESFCRVIRSKMNAAFLIAKMNKTYQFKKVIFFSSTSGVFGNEGQVDYAYVNMLLNRLCERNDTNNMISISWPFWNIQGMAMSQEYQDKIYDAYGFRPMPVDVGIGIIKQALSDTVRNLIILYGNREKLEDFVSDEFTNQFIEVEIAKNSYIEQNKEVKEVPNEDLLDRVIEWVTNIISNVTGIDSDSLLPKKPIQNLGIDSVMTTEINIEFEKVFENISKTLLFEYRCIREIAEYFFYEHYDKCKETFMSNSMDEKIVEVEDFNEVKTDVLADLSVEEQDIFDVAIIGIAGKYPKAKDLEEFWENLKKGIDCIDIIPKSRWNYINYCDQNSKEWWKSPEKWGGFIEGVDQFDSLVFNISPAEAKTMDPHQRIYSEIVWHTLEDAGYSRKRLEQYKVGVYTGAMWSNYQLYGIEDAYNGKMEGYDSSLASISNRISYLFNLHGPSITLDTMCSSSLTALQLAYKGIQNKDIDMAIVGGVNLTIHPYKYIQLKKGNFLAKDGRCRSFGEGGTGYAPSEGAGAIIVKRLDMALNDKDKIYGIVKGISVNHGGKAQGYFVPNPIEQAHVINEAIENAGIERESISYIEAHGTGTSLGDPIEIAGLKKVFKQSNNDKKFLRIGSVKSNIGHLEAAAGIASITKVLLQMKNRMLVPSIHAETLNPNLHLENTPFKVQTQLEPWSVDSNMLFRAGISAFGAGGANAHVIIEDYNTSYDDKISTSQEKIFVLSAKDKKSLLRYIDLYIDFLMTTPQVQEESEFDTRLAYTTQIGRNHMNMRLAIIFEHTGQLIQCLKSVSLEGDNSRNVYVNHVSNDKLDVRLFEIESEQNEIHTKPNDIAKAWGDGYEVDWEKLYPEKMPIVQLPLYPFSKIRHWAPLGESQIYKKVENQVESNMVSIDLYRKQWNEQILDNKMVILNENNVIVLIQPQQLIWINKLKKTLDVNNITIGIMNSTGIENIETTEIYTICDLTEENGFEAFLSNLKLNLNNQTMVIDFSDVLSNGNEIYEIPHGKLKFYQEIIKQTRKRGINIVHCTQGKSEGNTQNGVLVAGLLKNIAVEYEWIQSKTVDFTVDYSFSSMLNCLKDELCFDDTTEILYSKGIRNVIGYQRLELNLNCEHDFSIQKDKCYIITGGTRGIGAQIALHLARMGATKLVLLGRTSMDTPEKRELTNRLESMGVAVMIYTKGLHNKDELLDFFGQVRQQFGKAHMLFHCAGRYSNQNAAFLYKEKKEIEDVLEPKVNGVLNIIHATSTLEIDKIVLFSSISSISPWLAKGVSDYTMANNYLNYMPVYGRNFTKSQILTIVWQSWSDVGFQVAEPKVSQEKGLVAIQSNEGMEMLFQIVNREESGVIVPIKHKENFEIGKLSVFMNDQSNEKSYKNLEETSKQTSVSRLGQISSIIIQIISDILLIDVDEISLDEAFENYGMDSIFLGAVIKKLEEVFQEVIDPVLFFECNTVRKLSNALSSIVNISASKEEQPTVKQVKVEQNTKFAIIGMSCKFSDANNTLEFWNNLMEEKCSVREVSKERFDMEPFYSSTPAPNKSVGKWAALMKDIEYFDPKTFEIQESEAATMDPLIRLQIENSVNALRNAGYDREDVKGKNIGVFVGSRVGDFHNLIPKEEKRKITGLGQNFIAAYTSQYLDLKGPSMVIDTACSSSLVCLSEACKNILFGECDEAIVSGVDVILCENTFLLLSDALSPTGVCSAFDEKANGFVPGEGCGSIVIKKFDQAIEDGDNVLAVIESVAINNDGRTMGITTPSFTMQMDVIKRAIERADINPESISYVEAHGTGTFIGDPIELKALTNVFHEYTSKKQYCAIGSVKTNIGHCLSAAGMASLIKVILCLQNKMIPKTLNCNYPNPRFHFEQSPFYPAVHSEKWNGINGKRVAGISSFGFGGTNAHVILSDYTGNHEVLRQPLAPLDLNKKYYWVDKKKAIEMNTESVFDMFGFKKIY